MQNSPKISVHIISYNREQFIVQAIESVLKQQTNFPFEIVIGEDCSTDATRAIVLKYARKFPDLIRVLLHSQNMGMTKNFITTYEQCYGEYIAFLDSDDYWISPHKLQKQANLLDRHPEVSMCGHWTDIFDHSTGKIVGKLMPQRIKNDYTLDDIFEHGILFHTSSMMCRKVVQIFPEWAQHIRNTDVLMCALNDCYGKMKIINETLAVHRLHEGQDTRSQSWKEYLESTKNSYNLIGVYLDLYKRDAFRQNLVYINMELYRLYISDKLFFQVFHTGLTAIKIAPTRIKRQVFSQLFTILVYQTNWFRHIIEYLRQIFCLIRIHGLGSVKRCCGETLYNRLKLAYYRFRGQN